MIKLSVIITTFNRPGLIGKALSSVLDQTYQDFEIIVVDDGVDVRAEKEVASFSDGRIKYVQNERSLGGAAARNVGIKASAGKFIAFLDDDDEWEKNKLEIQMGQFEETGEDVGFSFTGVRNMTDTESFCTIVPVGVSDYSERALTRFSGFLTSTLIIKSGVFESIGFFNEALPSHQEPELVIRITKKFKGLGVDEPLTRMNLRTRSHINSSFDNRIKGREMILEMHRGDFEKIPKVYAKHLFGLGLFYRDRGRYREAKKCYREAIEKDKHFRYFVHYFLLLINYYAIKKIAKKWRVIILKKSFFNPIHFGMWLRSMYFQKYSKIIAINNVKKILDAGCGRGYYSYRLSKIFPKSLITACDIKRSDDWIQYKQENLNFTIQDLNFLDEKKKYDLITSIDVLEHIKNNKIILEKFYRLLNTGGVAYIAIPCGKNRQRFFPERFFGKFREWESVEHVGEQYDLPDLSVILESMGFRIIFSRYTFSFFGNLAWELEFIVRESGINQKINILLMPIYKMMGFLDIYFPIGKGNLLFIVAKD